MEVQGRSMLRKIDGKKNHRRGVEGYFNRHLILQQRQRHHHPCHGYHLQDGAPTPAFSSSRPKRQQTEIACDTCRSRKLKVSPDLMFSSRALYSSTY